MTKLFDLILINRKGKIASCWNAAIINKILFKNFYGSAHIQKINIEETCNEILKEIENNFPTLNLQQASQLMYGVIQIFKEQVIKFEKDVCETMKKLFFKSKKPKKEIVNEFVRDLIDLPLPNENHLISRLANAKDLHLLQEIDLKQDLFMEAEARLDFGALTNEEMMDVMIDRRNMNESISPIGRARDSVNGKIDTINDIDIAEEVYRERHESQEPSSQVVSVLNVEERREVTPQKRQPRHVQAETPTKRRRLSFETAVATDIVPLENVTVPEIHITEAPVLSLSMEEMPEITELEKLKIKKNKRISKKLKIDKKIILKNDALKQWQQNARIYSGELIRPDPHHVNAKNLFKQPAKRWGTTLKKHVFDKYIIEPFTSATEDFTLPVAQEALEQEIRTSSIENLRNISGMHASFPVDNSAAHKTLIQTIPNTGIQEIDMISTTQLVTESIPHITTLEDNINIESHLDQEDPVPLGAQRQIVENHICSQLEPTLDEILTMVDKKIALVKTDQKYIKFEELIKDKSKEEAAITFFLLLLAYMQKKIFLQQEACLAPLYIMKYFQVD